MIPRRRHGDRNNRRGDEDPIPIQTHKVLLCIIRECGNLVVKKKIAEPVRTK